MLTFLWHQRRLPGEYEWSTEAKACARRVWTLVRAHFRGKKLPLRDFNPQDIEDSKRNPSLGVGMPQAQHPYSPELLANGLGGECVRGWDWGRLEDVSD